MTSFAKIPGERANMPFANAIATRFLVLNSLSTFIQQNFMQSTGLRWLKTASLSQKMFTTVKRQKWTVVESILIDYHTMRTSTFVAMDESQLQMNANNLLSIRYCSNLWPPLQLIPGFKNPFHLTTGPFKGQKSFILNFCTHIWPCLIWNMTYLAKLFTA